MITHINLTKKQQLKIRRFISMCQSCACAIAHTLILYSLQLAVRIPITVRAASQHGSLSPTPGAPRCKGEQLGGALQALSTSTRHVSGQPSKKAASIRHCREYPPDRPTHCRSPCQHASCCLTVSSALPKKKWRRGTKPKGNRNKHGFPPRSPLECHAVPFPLAWRPRHQQLPRTATRTPAHPH